MPPKKVPINGEPDFTNVSDSKLKDYIDMVQQLIFVYKHCDKQKTEILQEMWKEMSNEQCDRKIVQIESEPEEVIAPTIHKIKTIKRIKR